MIGPKEFECIDCGIHVYRVVNHAANDQDICAECEWLRGIKDPVEREKLRQFLQGPREGEEDPVPPITTQLCQECGSEGVVVIDERHEVECPVCEGTGGEVMASEDTTEDERMEEGSDAASKREG